MKELCENIYKQSRKNAGLEQIESADKLGVSARSLQNYESELNPTLPPLDIVRNMCILYKDKSLAYKHIKKSPIGEFIPDFTPLPSLTMSTLSMVDDFTKMSGQIMKNIGKDANAQDYYENIKDGFKLPAIYFPEPECNLSKDTFGNQYQHSNMLFVQVFHLTNDDAYSLASDIATEFFKTGCYIPIINSAGNETGMFLHVNVQKVSRIDDCVAQIQLSWNYGSRYLNSENKANNINLNFNMEG